MTTASFTATILVDQSPAAVFNAINNPRAWWSEEITGGTEKLHDEFDYHYEDIHRCRMRITESVANKKVVWLVLDNYFKPGIFTDAATDVPAKVHAASSESEWTGTTVLFEIDTKDNKTQLRFTHQGLVPSFECYHACVNGWSHYIQQSLLALITTGKGQPNSTGKPMTSEEKKLQAAGKG